MRRILIVTALLLTCAAGADAQEPAAQDRPKGFFGLDLSAGGMWYPPPETVPEGSGNWGWDVGASVRFVRWLGITGTFGRHSIENLPTYQVAVGPRLTTPYIDWGLRAFAHALVGFAHTSGWLAIDGEPTPSSAEWVIGGGVDVLYYLRLQGDYVGMNLQGLPKNNSRVFVGGVVPLCFRAYRGQEDGIPVGSARRKMHEPGK